MATYLLDTSVLIAWLKKTPGAEETLLSLSNGRDRLAVCCVSVAEVYSGLYERDRDRFEALVRDIDYWDVPPSAARLAGDVRFEWARRGRQISTPDALQAALAIDRDAFFVTLNVKDFPMPELKLVAFGH